MLLEHDPAVFWCQWEAPLCCGRIFFSSTAQMPLESDSVGSRRVDRRQPPPPAFNVERRWRPRIGRC
eukprot:8171127-Pyramimonas_sp.AAC.1